MATEERAHSTIGASSSERWINCPRSVYLSEHAPRKLESKYAAEGTNAHQVAELTLRGDSDAVLDLMGANGYPAEMFSHAEAYSEFVNEKRKTGAEVLVEHAFHLKRYDKRAYGTADAVIVNPTELWVIDYKYGAGIAVEATDNPQLRFYALGALFSLTPARQKAIDTIHMAIFQPRAAHTEGPVRVATMTKKALMAWGRTVLKPAMEKTLHYDAPVVPGKWCRWCPAITLCPEQGRLPVKVAATADFGTPDVSSKLPAPKQLTPEQIGVALMARDQIEAWFDAVAGIAKSNLESGGSVPGWKLVQGRRQKSWMNDGEAEALLALAYGDKAYTKKLISPAAAQKLGFDAAHMVHETFTQTSLAPAEDKRQSVQPSITTDFIEV